MLPAHQDVENENGSTETLVETTASSGLETPFGQPPTPLPKFQLFVVYLIQFAEPVTATVIYPFANQFVRDTGITGGDEAKTGYYAGIVGSVFFLAEAVTVFHWGQMSDRIGRRPVLLLGPIGLAVAMFCFGLSTTFWTLLASRSLQGVFNGVLGVSRTIVAELTDSTNIGDIFALTPVVRSIGFTIGPSVGGFLAEPAKRWPLFENALFVEHPYFLPCAATGALATITAILGFFGLHETLPSALRKLKGAQISTNRDGEAASLLGNSETTTRYGSIGDQEQQEAPIPSEEKPIAFRDLLTSHVLITLLVYMFQAFNTMTMMVLHPLIYSTSIPLGGLGFSAYDIGLVLTTFGLVNAVFQLWFMGNLMRKYGARSLQISNHIATLLKMMLYPPLIMTVQRAGKVDEVAWAILFIQHLLRLTNGLGWGSMQVLVVNSSPSRAALGATNGLAQAVACVTRAVAPTVASSLFSFSIEKQYMDGNLVYFVLMTIEVVGIWTSFWLPRPGRNQK